jgi:hypothetical protein
MKRSILSLAGLVLLALTVRAQDYSVDWFTMVGSGGTLTGDGYSLSATIGQPDAGGTLSGEDYTLEGGFWNADPGPSAPSMTIFDNTGGSENGYEGATATTWLADKFCLGAQPYSLDSVSLLLNSQDFSGAPGPPSTVQLQIFADDPAGGGPSARVGIIMNLYHMTNPITLQNGQQLVTWIPAAPFTLSADTCYWAVLSAQDGVRMAQINSATMPTGAAAAFGRTKSIGAGATWGVPDTDTNRKMLIQGTALALPTLLAITAVEPTGNDLRLAFTSAVGKNYAIQSRSDLSSDAWTTLPGPTIAGTGSTVQQTLTNALDRPRQFYRVKIVP